MKGLDLIAYNNNIKRMQREKQPRTSLRSVFSQTHPSRYKSPPQGNQAIKLDRNINSLPFSPRKFDSFPQELNINKLDTNIMKSGQMTRDVVKKESRLSRRSTLFFNVPFQSYFTKMDSEIKIEKLLFIVKKYKQLVTIYGLFLLMPQHIMFTQSGVITVWINNNLQKNFAEWPLPNTKQGQVAALAAILQLAREHLSDRVHKFVKAESFGELIIYLERMQKRNSIHKKCQVIVKEKSLGKKKVVQGCSSPKYGQAGFRLKRFASSDIDIRIHGLAQRKVNDIQRDMESGRTQNNYMLPTSESLTNFSTNKGSNVGSALIDHQLAKQKKSCTIDQACKENYFGCLPIDESINGSEYSGDRKEEQMRSADVVELLVESRKGKRGHLQAKSSLQASFNKLFLSDIKEDLESDMQTSKGKNDSYQQQLIKDFSNVFQ